MILTNLEMNLVAASTEEDAAAIEGAADAVSVVVEDDAGAAIFGGDGKSLTDCK